MRKEPKKISQLFLYFLKISHLFLDFQKVRRLLFSLFLLHPEIAKTLQKLAIKIHSEISHLFLY